MNVPRHSRQGGLSSRCLLVTRPGSSLAARAGANPVEALMLESGDVFVFGGASRLRYHGVSRVLPDTAPSFLGPAGRFNLTFRRY